MINRQRIVEEFFELVQIDSPTLQERQIAEVLKSRLEALNFEVTEDRAGEALGGNCGNLFAYLTGNVPDAPVLLLSAHMDTVQPGYNIQPVLKDGVITSAGPTILGADDKSGIVPILEALRVIQEQNLPHGDIQVLFCVAEEGGVNGSRNLDQTLLRADFGYILDSGGKPGTVIIEAPGQERLNIVIKGKASHAGVAPEQGVSAIVTAAQAISGMRTGRIDEETTANIGTIQGGRATNIVADQVTITAESRSRNLEKMVQQTAHMVETFKRCAKEMGAEVEIEVRRAYEPYVLDENSHVAQLFTQVANKLGLTPQFTPSGGGSDANHINRYGVPCVVLGNGMAKSHTVDEYILEEDLYQATELVVEIIKQAALFHKE